MNSETNDVLNYDENVKPKLPTGLNVLTILTFIGSAYELYSTISSFFGGKNQLAELEKAEEKLAEAPSWLKKFTGPEVKEMMAQAIENRIPLLVLGLIAIILCVYGAIEMRKLKKQGYTLWLIGEVLPYISVAIFLPSFFNTIFASVIIIPLIFILLYTLQIKHLKY